MLHFAYGSNLLVERLQVPERAPGAWLVGVARLAGWRLVFDKRGRDGSGKASVRQAPDAWVHGVLYDLPDDDRKRLDQVEGPGYRAHEVEVRRGGRAESAWLYLAIDLDPTLRPFRWYRGLVLAGARQHRLPDAYAAAIEEVPVMRDPDRQRAERYERVIEAVNGRVPIR